MPKNNQPTSRPPGEAIAQLTPLLGSHAQHGRRLGLLFTVSDLASAVGPPLAYALIPLTGIRGVYWLAAGLFGLVALIARWWARNEISEQ